eukprot:CAMPEP_0194366184 /NCGR_PEP_ID=MMETSP0174-20130528/14205_1 /TAXON_ID=216777 /ORGANISM="Proboscia alata, Strain PI-D3" /LENGTH=581 /DNA_ID=CAMNT_0039141233 /DNA_START=217 /DNA_END=1959 /DNA_ORIENTATION=-
MNATENDSNLRVIDDDDVEGDIVRLTFDEDFSDIVSNLSDGSSYHTVESEDGSPSKFPDKKKRRRSTVELRRSTEKARISTLQQYAVLNFDFERKAYFRTSVASLERMLSWKRRNIEYPLHKGLPDHERKDALEIFRSIFGFMEDNSTTDRTSHMIVILSIVIDSNEKIRDETICQVLTQMNRNPSAISVIRGWQLLLIILACVPPSEALKDSVCTMCNNFLSSNNFEQSPNSHVMKLYIEHVTKKIPSINIMLPRQEIPSQAEIVALKRCANVKIQLYTFKDKTISVSVSSWDTSQDVVAKACNCIGIADSRPFGIFEIAPNGTTKPLSSNDRPLDYLSSWSRKQFETKIDSTVLPNDYYEKFRFVLKARFHFPLNENDKIANEMRFTQAVEEILNFEFPFTFLDALELAALQMQNISGDLDSVSGRLPLLRGCNEEKKISHLKKFVCAKFVTAEKLVEIERTLFSFYKKLKGNNAYHARCLYLGKVLSLKLYGCSYFSIQTPQPHLSHPLSPILPVNHHGLTIMNSLSESIISCHEFPNIMDWGYSPNSFAFIEKNEKGNSIYHCFLTLTGMYIHNMVT